MDYTKIKEGIDKRKSEMGTEQPQRMATNGAKDSFLNELLESVHTKQPKEAVKKVMAIDREAENKRRANNGLPPKEYPKEQEYVPKAPEGRRESYTEPRLSEEHLKERDDLFEQNLNRKNNGGGLSEALGQYGGNNGGYNPPQGQQQYPNYNYPPQGQQPQNPNVLVEQATNITNQFLNENFAGIVHEAMKSTIVEEYKQERVNKALRENRDMIKDIVIDVIKEIQSKSKKK